MRTTQFLLATQRENPAGAELASHQLMIKAGLIRKLGSGLYTWLPMGMRVLHKVSEIVRQEMDRIGCQEILMPQIQPATLWQETGRWSDFGPLLLCMQDRAGNDYCFGPTHEEVVTDLMRHTLVSYKQLPMSVYQLQTKFRDEIRPRFGVMRAREFTMKDAYSFHIDADSLKKTYAQMHQAYTAIFNRIGVQFRVVEADSGAIGGDSSHEFHVLAEAGEDTLAYSDGSDFAANLEKCPTLPPVDKRAAPSGDLEKVSTPGMRTVAEQTRFMGMQPNQALKTLFVKGCEDAVVALMVRGDYDINPLKAEKHPLVHAPMTLVDDATLTQVAGCEPGFVGPIGLDIPMIADYSVQSLANFTCGANETDMHYKNVNIGRDFKEPDYADLRFAVAGEASPDNKGTLKFCRGIEVGHIFALQDKYSKAMQATVLDPNGKAMPLQMGCYGLGVSRVVAACIEQCHDDKGIIWPASISPFDIALVPLNYQKSDAVKNATDALYETLSAQFDVLLDDRNERPGVKFNDMELIGLPWRITVGERSLKENQVEIISRDGQHQARVDLDKVMAFISNAN